jgi:electron transfer flavoprotein beta subunit
MAAEQPSGSGELLTMNIIVCIKQVLDPEAPASLFKVDSEAKRVLPPKGTPPVMNPFDENALEAALKIKDINKAQISVMSLGRTMARPILRKSLAAGADELILLEDEVFDNLDTVATANVLAAAIKKYGPFDIILCGREAADTDAGQVGSGIAEILGIPSVTLAAKVEVIDNKLRVNRVLPDGYETIEVPTPALVTASSEIGSLRTAAMAGILAAQKKPVKVWNAQELGVTPSQYKKSSMIGLVQPVRDSKCEMITAASPEDAGSLLAARLKDAKVL